MSLASLSFAAAHTVLLAAAASNCAQPSCTAAFHAASHLADGRRPKCACADSKSDKPWGVKSRSRPPEAVSASDALGEVREACSLAKLAASKARIQSSGGTSLILEMPQMQLTSSWQPALGSNCCDADKKLAIQSSSGRMRRVPSAQIQFERSCNNNQEVSVVKSCWWMY